MPEHNLLRCVKVEKKGPRDLVAFEHAARVEAGAEPDAPAILDASIVLLCSPGHKFTLGGLYQLTVSKNPKPEEEEPKAS